MPGRYALHTPLPELAERFHAKISDTGLWDWEGNYNISPGTVVPVIAFDGKKQRKLVPMRWGLHPHWKKEPPEGRPLFNARLDTVAEKASFRTPFRRRRALIPANGWYEWDPSETPKTPHYITETGQDIFAFAGLWDKWSVDEGITLLSVCVITMPASGPIKHIHHRMGVRLPREHWDAWLDWDANPKLILETRRTGDNLEITEVDRAVNSGRANGPDLIKPLGA